MFGYLSFLTNKIKKNKSYEKSLGGGSEHGSGGGVEGSRPIFLRKIEIR